MQTRLHVTNAPGKGTNEGFDVYTVMADGNKDKCPTVICTDLPIYDAMDAVTSYFQSSGSGLGRERKP